MKVTLNEGQALAKKEILGVIHRNKSDEDKFITFFGPAGTGKTFTFIDIVNAIDDAITIGLCAPTHKAVKVMRAMAYKHNIDGRVDIRTIHSALGLGMKQVEGDEVLFRDEWAEEQPYDIMFIDESSMLGDDILAYILESVSHTIVFIGDKCQINPVGATPGTISSVFTEVARKVGLTEVMRQGAGNPIIDLATALRLIQDDIYADWPAIQTDLLEDGAGVNVIPKMQWFNSVVEIFGSNEYKTNPDFCRCIAYTNDMVDKINAKVRRTLHGSNVAEYLVGEIIVAQTSGKLHRNAEEMKIISIDEIDDPIHNIPCYEMQLSSIDTHNIYRVLVLRESSIPVYEQKLARLANLANNIDKQNKRQHWREFWDIKKTFDQFKHIYAMTAHKSQGSTFHHTFIWTPDFLRFGASMETKQLLYTATTRSSYRTTFTY